MTIEERLDNCEQQLIESALLAHAVAFGVNVGIDLETAISLVRELYEAGGVRPTIFNGEVHWSVGNTEAAKVFGLKTALYHHIGTRH